MDVRADTKIAFYPHPPHNQGSPQVLLNSCILQIKYIWLTRHSGLKGEIPEKNVSEDLSMDSISKIYFDFDKL